MQYIFYEGAWNGLVTSFRKDHDTFPLRFDPDEPTLVAKETKFVILIDGFMRLERPLFGLFVVSISFKRI
jgi:hypothetical protein